MNTKHLNKFNETGALDFMFKQIKANNIKDLQQGMGIGDDAEWIKTMINIQESAKKAYFFIMKKSELPIVSTYDNDMKKSVEAYLLSDGKNVLETLDVVINEFSELVIDGDEDMSVLAGLIKFQSITSREVNDIKNKNI